MTFQQKWSFSEIEELRERSILCMLADFRKEWDIGLFWGEPDQGGRGEGKRWSKDTTVSATSWYALPAHVQSG